MLFQRVAQKLLFLLGDKRMCLRWPGVCKLRRGTFKYGGTARATQGLPVHPLPPGKQFWAEVYLLFPQLEHWFKSQTQKLRLISCLWETSTLLFNQTENSYSYQLREERRTDTFLRLTVSVPRKKTNTSAKHKPYICIFICYSTGMQIITFL